MTGTVDPAAALGAALAALQRGDAAGAVALAGRVLAARPRWAPALQLLGTALLHDRRFTAAEAAFREAMGCDTTPALARYHLGLLHLLQGDFARGWAGWEARLGVPALGHPRLPCPGWDGAPAPDGRLLLLGEHGFGDIIQFLRFAPATRAHFGGAVVLGLPPPLQALAAPFCAAHGILLHRGANLDAAGFTAHAFVGSLPHLLGIAPAEFAAGVPYLAAEPVRQAAWRRRRPARLRCIGLVWEGRATHPQDALRSVPPGLLAPLAGLPDLCLVGLQRPPVRGAPPAGLLGMDWGPDIADFAEAIAMLGALDGLVTVDTAMAHLAGAAGVPTCLLLPYTPDWRWGLAGAASAWYPSLTLLRQPRPGDWAAVVAEAAAWVGRIGPGGAAG